MIEEGRYSTSIYRPPELMGPDCPQRPHLLLLSNPAPILLCQGHPKKRRARLLDSR